MYLFGNTRVIGIDGKFDDKPRSCLCDKEHEGWRLLGASKKVAILLEDSRCLAVPPEWLTEVPDPPGWAEDRSEMVRRWRGSTFANDFDFPVKLAFAMAANEVAEAISSRR